MENEWLTNTKIQDTFFQIKLCIFIFIWQMYTNFLIE